MRISFFCSCKTSKTNYTPKLDESYAPQEEWTTTCSIGTDCNLTQNEHAVIMIAPGYLTSQPFKWPVYTLIIAPPVSMPTHAQVSWASNVWARVWALCVASCSLPAGAKHGSKKRHVYQRTMLYQGGKTQANGKQLVSHLFKPIQNRPQHTTHPANTIWWGGTVPLHTYGPKRHCWGTQLADGAETSSLVV